jgi:MFS family permease
MSGIIFHGAQLGRGSQYFGDASSRAFVVGRKVHANVAARIVTRGERDFVMAVWSAYMPAGIMLMLLVGPLLPIIGWRNLWIVNALVTGACGVLLAICAPRLRDAVPLNPTDRFFSDVARIARNPAA